MRRIAAHRICFSPENTFSTSYVELAADGTLLGVYPLTEEIAGTVFANGALLMVPASQCLDIEAYMARIDETIRHSTQPVLSALLEKAGLHAPPLIGEAYHLLHLERLNLPTPEFGTNNSRRYRYVKRF